MLYQAELHSGMDAADKAGRDVTSVAAGPRRAPVIAVLEGQSKRLNAPSSRTALPPSGGAVNPRVRAAAMGEFLD